MMITLNIPTSEVELLADGVRQPETFSINLDVTRLDSLNIKLDDDSGVVYTIRKKAT